MNLLIAFGLMTLLILSERGAVVEAQNCTNGTAPPRPPNVTASAVSFSCVEVSWMPPSDAGGGSAVITRYHITWTGTGGSHTTEDTTYQVTGLTPATTYSFTVSAENSCNMTSPGATDMATTEVVPAVTNVTARPVSSSAIRVNWTYSTPTCGSVDGFELTYRRDGGAEVMRTVSDVSSRSVDITNLEGLQGTYTVNMTALYQSVPSTPSGPVTVIFMVPPPPGGVTATATSGSSITVTWTSPPVQENRPPVTAYTVTTIPSSGTSPTTAPASTTSTVLSGLQEDTTYTIQVVARNVVGSSSAVNASVQTFDRPGVPQYVTVSLLSDTSIYVEWLGPALDGGDGNITYNITVTYQPHVLTRTTMMTNTTITGLEAPRTYLVEVTAINRAGPSVPGRKFIHFQVPVKPNITDLTATNTTLTVTWANSDTGDDNAWANLDTAIEVDSYNVTVVDGNSRLVGTSMVMSSTNTSSLPVPDKGVTYTVTVTAVNKVGPSTPASRTFYFAVPGMPTNVAVTALSGSELNISWTAPNWPTNGAPVMYYAVSWKAEGGEEDSQNTASPLNTMYQITGLAQGTRYTVTVTAHNSVGESEAATGSGTTFNAPGPPQSVQLTATSPNSIAVSWTMPSDNGGTTIIRYEVTLKRGTAVEETKTSTSENTDFTGLLVGESYTVEVVAVNSVGTSNAASNTIDFSVPPPPGGVTAMATSGSSITVTWTPPVVPANGAPVTAYTVTAVPSSGSTVQNTSSTTSTVLSGLQEDTEYTIQVVAHNAVGSSSAGTASARTFTNVANIGPVVGAAVGATLAAVCLVALLVLVVGLLVRRGKRRSQLPRRRGPGQMRVWDSTAQFTDTIRMAIHERGANLSGSQQDLIAGQEDSPLSTPVMGRRNTKPSHPVSLDGFVGYVENTSREDLIAEYRSIPTKTHDLMALALMNPLSNRYINILPYDKNRVILSEPNSDGNDYINASYIDGYEKEHAFIAAQGPLQRTVDDFWQMVWDQQTSVMVMLTKCMEGTKSKCAEYFPKNVNGRVFVKMSIAVETKSIHMYKDYEVRVLQVKNNKTGSTRLVHHFYYFGWPDFGVPESPTGVLTMLHHVRAIRRSGDQDAPAIIHCSAGVGRTGTFIALDYLVHQVQAEGENAMIDIEALVSTMRAQRGTMVQASEQYVFIHRALREYLLLGYTMMPGPELRSKVEEMSPVKRHSGISPFQEQYERLEYITAPYTQAPKVDEEFQSKIRFPNKGPYEGKYIGITPVAGDFSSSFINASVVDGYRQTKQFIVAQSPMHSTTGDFWALVYEKQSPTVILLCPFQENGEESSVCFWPSKVGNTENFVGYKVTWKSEDVSPSFATHRLVVQPDAEDLSPLDVTLFHLENWSAATMPKSGAVLSLLETVRAGQREGPTSPTVVACNDGLGRSCLFVALWVLTDQLMTEDQVDVVSTFKALRANRPGAMDSLDYFIHCYHLLMQYREMHNPTQEE